MDEELKNILYERLRQKVDADSLAKAQELSDQSTFDTSMIEAGTRGLTAAVGGKMEPNLFQASRDQNRQMIANYLEQQKQQRAMEDQRLDAAKILASLEKKKEKTVAYRDTQILPDPTNPKQLKKVITSYDEQGNVVGAPVERRASEEEYKRQQDELDAAFKQKQLSSRENIAEKNINLREAIQTQKEQTKLSDAMLKWNLPTLDKLVNRVDQLATKDEQGNMKIPGFATSKAEQAKLYVRRKADMLSPQETESRTVFQQLANTELKSQSGAAVTDGEYRRFLEGLKAGSIFDFSPLQVENYMGLMKEELARKKQVIKNIAPDVYARQYETPDLTEVNKNIPPAKTGSGLTPEQRQKKIQELKAKLNKK